MNKYVIIGILLLVIVSGVMVVIKTKSQPEQEVASSDSEPMASPDNKQDAKVEGANTQNKEATVSAQEFTVVGSNFQFVPNELKVKKGDKVKIIFQNQDGTHNLRIDALNVTTKVIQGGETDSVEFTADKTGKFEYYCSIGKHRQMGMTGMLTVE